MEDWYKIPYLPNYEVSQLRRVRNATTGRIKKPNGDPDTANTIYLHKDAVGKYYNRRDLLNDALKAVDNDLV